MDLMRFFITDIPYLLALNNNPLEKIAGQRCYFELFFSARPNCSDNLLFDKIYEIKYSFLKESKVFFNPDIPYLRELAHNNSALTDYNDNYHSDNFYDNYYDDNQTLFFRHPLLERTGPQQQPTAED